MNRLSRPGRGRRPVLDLAPVVDIALLLVVFLLLAGGAAPREEVRLVPVELPRVAAGIPAAASASLVVSARGRCFVGQQALPDADIGPRFADQHEVVVRADRACPHGRVLEIVDLLRAAGVGRVRFAARPPGAEDEW